MPRPKDEPPVGRETAREQRWQLLHTVSRSLRWPMTALGIAWVVLLVVDLAGLVGEPWSGTLAAAQAAIWILFVLQFALELALAPCKAAYLRGNWLTAVAVVLPAFRVLAVVRLLRVVPLLRGLSLVRLVTAVNRGMGSVREITGVAQFPFVVGVSVLVVLAVAAGMTFLERGAASGLGSFGEALWWSAAMLTTIGSGQWPATAEGRVLAFLMMVYSMAIFGYITATLAGYFVKRNADREREQQERRDGGTLEAEVRRLRREIQELRRALDARGAVPGGGGAGDRR